MHAGMRASMHGERGPVHVAEAIDNTRNAVAASAVASAHEVTGSLHKKIEAQKQQIKNAGSRMKTRKSTRTRQRIIDAAKEIITEKGTIEFQMSEVAERCNMSKGALYYYFKDRSQIVGIVDAEVADQVISTVERVGAESETAVEALRAICESFAEALSSNAAGFSALLGEFLRRGYGSLNNVDDRYAKLIELTRGLIDRGKQEGSVRSDVSSSLVANGLLGMFLFTAMDYLALEDTIDRSEFSKQLMGIVLDGIGTQGDGA